MTREDFILTAKERGYTLEETKSAMERFRADGNIFDDERAVSVEDNFSDLSIDEEALQNTSDPKKQSIIGKVAGYLSSSAKQDFDHIYGNVEQYVKSFTGNKDATVESAYSDIQTNVLDIKSIDSTDNIVSLIVDDALGDRAESYKQIPVTELKDIEVPEQVEQVADQELVKINPEDFNIPSQSTPLTVTADISMDEPLVEDFYIAPMGAYGEMDEERFRQLKAKLPYGLGELDLKDKKIDVVRQLQAEEAFLALPEEEQAKAYMLEMTANPAMQLNVGIVETVLPDWLQPFDVFGVEISDPKTTTQSLARASGNITGFITSMVTANKFLQGAGGVRAIPYVRTVLNNITKTSPKSAMYVERSLNTFAAFTLRNQAFVDPTTPIEERTKMLKEDALYSIAFPAADIMSQMRGGLAVGTTTIFAVGFNSGEGTTSEKTINGASLTLMWLLSQGLSYKSGKAQLKEFLKQSGLERNVLKPNGTSANDFINSLNRAEVMKASSNLNALIYKNKYINSEAVSIYSKPKPNSADSVVMSAANESSAVGLAKQGALPPIQGDRSVKLLNQAVAVAKKQPVVKPAPVAKPAVKPTVKPVVEETAYDVNSKEFVNAYASLNPSKQVSKDIIPPKMIRNTELNRYEFFYDKNNKAVQDVTLDSLFTLSGRMVVESLDPSAGFNVNKFSIDKLGQYIIDNNITVDKFYKSAGKNLIRADLVVKQAIYENGKFELQQLQSQPIDEGKKLIFLPTSKLNKKSNTFNIKDATDINNIPKKEVVFALQVDKNATGEINLKNKKQVKPVKKLTNSNIPYYLESIAKPKIKPVVEPAPVAEPVPSEATQAKLFESDPQMKLAEQQKLIQQYNDPKELAYQLSLVPEVPAEIVMQESERLLPELYKNAKLADETEMPVGVWNDKAINSTRKTIETFTNVFRKFGRAYVSDRKLLKKLDESFAQISAAPLKGISDINSAFEKFPATSKSDRVAVTLTFEAGTRDALEPRLQPIYDMVESASRSLEKSLIDSGILKKSFAELRQQKIDDLVAELGTKVKPKRSEEIRKELDYLRDVQKYLSHSIVSQRVFEVKSKEPNKKLRQKFQGSLRDFHQTRKGLFSLGQYYESGLLKESDLDIVKILMSTYADGYQKLAVRSLVDWGMASNYIVPKNQPLTYPDNYISGSETQYSNRIADIENYNVHRLFDDGLLEIMGYNSKPTNVWEKMAGMVKVGQFFNPFIIYKYNAQQALYGQTFTIKPKVWGKAFNAVKNKDELFLQLDEAGLYQRIDIPIKRELDKQIAYYSRKTLNKNKEYYQEQMTAIVQDVLNLTPKQAIEFVKDKSFETIKNVILTPHTTTAQMTWFGDEVQRTASALKLINDGMDLKEAAQTAARIHGAYSNVGTPYRQFGRNVFFVYSFRLLMPKKYLIDPVIGVTKDIYNRVTGKKIDKRKARMLYMGLATTTGLHYAQEIYLKSQGWEEAPEERESGFRKLTDKFTLKIGNTKFRGLLPTYKYVKNVDMPDGTTKQIVLPKTDIMTMVPKVLVRATSPKSGDVDLLGQRVWDALKFEITPLFNIGKAFALNEPYYGELPPRGLDGTDVVGGLGWMFKKTFVGWDAGKQAELLGLTKDEDNDRVLKENLNAIETAMAWFASEYIRSLPEDRAVSEVYKLRNKSKQLAKTIQNADIPEEEKAMLMEKLVELIEDRIDAIEKSSK